MSNTNTPVPATEDNGRISVSLAVRNAAIERIETLSGLPYEFLIGVLYDKREVEEARKAREEQIMAQQQMAMQAQQAQLQAQEAQARSAQAQSVSDMTDASLTSGDRAEEMIRRQGYML